MLFCPIALCQRPQHSVGVCDVVGVVFSVDYQIASSAVLLFIMGGSFTVNKVQRLRTTIMVKFFTTKLKTQNQAARTHDRT